MDLPSGWGLGWKGPNSYLSLLGMYCDKMKRGMGGPFKALKLNIWIPIISLLGHYLVKKLLWGIISETSKYLSWYLIWLKFEANLFIWYLICLTVVIPPMQGNILVKFKTNSPKLESDTVDTFWLFGCLSIPEIGCSSPGLNTVVQLQEIPNNTNKLMLK